MKRTGNEIATSIEKACEVILSRLKEEGEITERFVDGICDIYEVNPKQVKVIMKLKFERSVSKRKKAIERLRLNMKVKRKHWLNNEEGC